MRKLNIPKSELEKITEEHRKIACHFAMPNGWNPLGNPDIFVDIQENIFNYILGRNHTLNKNEIEIVNKALSITQAEQARHHNNDFKTKLLEIIRFTNSAPSIMTIRQKLIDLYDEVKSVDKDKKYPSKLQKDNDFKKVCPCCYGEGKISDLNNGGTKRCPMCEGKLIQE